MVCVQAEGCAPVVRAWREGVQTTQPWESAQTHAAGLRVPSPFAGRQMLAVLRASGVCARTVAEREIEDARRLLARLEGIWAAPEAAATVAALVAMKEERTLVSDARIVLVLTGTGLKNPAPPLRPASDLEGSDDAMVERIAARVSG
jgi:threonine synthase